MSNEQTGHLEVRKTPHGWQIEADTIAFAGLVSALTRAITSEEQEGRAEEEEAQQWRALRKAMFGGRTGPIGPIF